MKVTLRFIGSVRDQMGVPSLPVEVPEGATYRAVLDAVEALMATRLEASLWDSEKRTFSRKIVVSLNGKTDLRDQAKVLNEGDEVLVLQPLAGG